MPVMKLATTDFKNRDVNVGIAKRGHIFQGEGKSHFAQVHPKNILILTVRRFTRLRGLQPLWLVGKIFWMWNTNNFFSYRLVVQMLVIYVSLTIFIVHFNITYRKLYCSLFE